MNTRAEVVKSLPVVAMAVVALVCGGCVANKAYRADGTVPHAERRASIQLGGRVGPDALGGAAAGPAAAKEDFPWPCKPSVTERDGSAEKTSEPFDLAFIEFDDMGEFWTIGNLKKTPLKDNSQLEESLELIKMRKKESGDKVVVITFIHGWRNNASEGNEKGKKNLCGFRNTLRSLAMEDHGQHRYIGIFISWRGTVISGDFFFTYFNRRDAANRIAGPSMTEALFKLMYATRPWTAMQNVCSAESAGTQRDPEDSHFVIVGHSFGGRLLERAVAQPFMAMMVERAARQAACGKSADFSPPADLIVFINPANDSLEGKAIIEGMLRLGVVSANQRPFFLSISSIGDFATRRGMPFAQWFTLSGMRSRKVYDEKADERGQLKKKQSFYFNNSEANVQELRSHQIKPEDCPSESNAGRNQIGSDIHFQVRKPAGGVPDCYVATKDPGDPWNKTPFWVIDAGRQLMQNHSDIFTPAIKAFFIQIVRSTHQEGTKLRISADGRENRETPAAGAELKSEK